VSSNRVLSTTSRTQISIPFSSLTSGNAAFVPSALAAIEFQPTTIGAFDLWIDDVSFY
jgi:hypothetical protein